MKELLKSYRQSLHETLEQIELLTSPVSKNARTKKGFDQSQTEKSIEMLKAAEIDIRFAIKWLEKGYQYDAHWRGIEKSDAYNLGEIAQEMPKSRTTKRLVDPYLMDYYIEDEKARRPFEMVDAEDVRADEGKEWDERLDAREKLLRKGLFEKMEQVKNSLCHIEIDILIARLQKIPQEETAQALGVSQQAVSKRIKSIKRKLAAIGIERADL